MRYSDLPTRARKALNDALVFCEECMGEDVGLGAARDGDDLMDLLDAKQAEEGGMSWRDYLPPKYRSQYDLPFLRRFLKCLEAVRDRIRAGTLPVANCTADELAFRYVAQTAEETGPDLQDGWTDDDADALTDYFEEAVMDSDVEFLFNMAADGIEDDPQFRPLRFENWFNPFRPGIP